MIKLTGRHFLLDPFLIVFLACGAVWVVARGYRNKPRNLDPYVSRVREAIKFGWKQTVEVPKDGFGAVWTQRSVRFTRDDEEAVLWHKNLSVTLIRSEAPLDFEDFDDLEKWLKTHPLKVEIDKPTVEQQYIREIHKFVARHGHHLSLLEAQSFDKDFFKGFYNLYKTGYTAQENANLIGGLILEALTLYPNDRDKALRFLSGFAAGIKKQPTTNGDQPE